MNQVQSPLSLAVSRAIAAAELRRSEMSRSLSPDRVSALLTDQAEAVAASPLPDDQLLAIALRAAAQPGDFESITLDALRAPADPFVRNEISREVLAKYGEGPSRAALKAAPDWELRRAPRRVGKSLESFANRLRSAAVLARSLWDHPALPIEPAVRGAMLATATILQRRADELAPPPSAAHIARPLQPAEDRS